ncbi:hypothetical protein Tco_1145360 [Tanacetum coccineum]
MFQRLGHYPTSVRVFPDPILLLAGLQSSWEHGQNGFQELLNIEPIRADEEPVLQLAEVTTDFGGSLEPIVCCLPWKPPVKRKLTSGSSNSRATRAKTSTSRDDVPFLTVSDDDEGLSDILELKDATACHLKIFAITPPTWKNHLDNHMDVELLDLHDRCYAQQNVVDNALNKRSRKLLEVIEKLRGECDVIKERERAREKEFESLRVKCEAAMSDFKKNPIVFSLLEKISTLSTKVKEHKANLERMMLESQKWVSYQASLSTLELHIASLEAEKALLEDVKISLRKEVDDVKRDRMEVVLKVVAYASMKLIHSDDLGSLVGRLVSFAILYGRCKTFEQVAAMKEPFDLSKVKGYRPLYKKEHDQAGNDLATTTFPWPAPLRTQALVASSSKATTSSVQDSNPMSPPTDASIIKPLSSHVE